MKPLLKRIAFYLLLIGSVAAFAASVEPVINYDVHVVQDAKPDQCPASWEGTIGEDQEVRYSGAGQETGITSPGVNSCTDCAIDKASGDCVCGTCYEHFDS